MVIGITGSIASGKSLVTEYLKNKNYKVVDCDLITHDVLEKEEVKKEINVKFPNVLNSDMIDRKLLGTIIFNDNKQKKVLENIVMPYIVNEINKQISNEKLIFLDAPTLLENNLQYLVDKLIVVKTSKETQINRLMARDNISRDYALKKINSQWPVERKIKFANYVIDNDKEAQDTYKQIEAILNCFKENKNED